MSISHKDNKAFIEYLTKGREEAYVYLVTTYNKPLFIYALSLTKDSADAQDIVQNVFLTIWKYRKRINTFHSIKNFLYKTTYHEFINHYNKKKAISKLEQTYIEALDETVDNDNTESLERKIKIVKKGIKQLPKRCKETFLLSKKEGLTNIEIAEYMNVSVKTVEVQLTKAYHLLRKLVGNELKSILFLLFGVPVRE
ncbi:RNA polymerase sigma factor [Flavivirga rizhaonensis]|uniref:Sigma-70 family RNA polymerase sigma factor n=1 Tax=Flavivirga rizhaonensis TaxID=2559571 RepID=A0A4S1DU83_9FLAO|nr:sigma-70 family RNA polymerase sigma factor [Flavivirga rizhaonensis]TGV01393.1 sigma-70 family RNA polymerase sigma factor [Flavivirga rizhaonensis]